MVFFGQSVLSRSLNTYIQNTSLLHQTVISGWRSRVNLETPDNSLNGQFYYSHPPPTNVLSSIFPSPWYSGGGEERGERNRINEWPKICDLEGDLLPVIPTSMYTAIKLACSLTCYSFEAPLQLTLVETVKCQTPSGGCFAVGMVHFTKAN